MQANSDDEEEAIEGMSSNEEDDDFMQASHGVDNDLLQSIDLNGLNDKQKRSKLKVAMVNKRLDELITVLDTCVADL